MVEKKAVAIPVPAADNSPMEEDKPLKKTPKELKDAPKEELVRQDLLLAYGK
jgi:26S proteasome regulatory subunit N1